MTENDKIYILRVHRKNIQSNPYLEIQFETSDNSVLTEQTHDSELR